MGGRCHSQVVFPSSKQVFGIRERGDCGVRTSSFHRQRACVLRHQKSGMKNHARSKAGPTHHLQGSVPICATKNSNCHVCVSFKKHPLNVSRSSSLFGILKLKPMYPVRLSQGSEPTLPLPYPSCCW